MTTAKLPWHCATEISSICGLPVVAADGQFICDMAVVPKTMPHADEINQEAKDNAALIVKCVNHHAELVEALIACRDYIEKDDGYQDVVNKADAVLAKIKGE
jgi:hypothetical protein